MTRGTWACLAISLLTKLLLTQAHTFDPSSVNVDREDFARVLQNDAAAKLAGVTQTKRSEMATPFKREQDPSFLAFKRFFKCGQ